MNVRKSLLTRGSYGHRASWFFAIRAPVASVASQTRPHWTRPWLREEAHARSPRPLARAPRLIASSSACVQDMLNRFERPGTNGANRRMSGAYSLSTHCLSRVGAVAPEPATRLLPRRDHRGRRQHPRSGPGSSPNVPGSHDRGERRTARPRRSNTGGCSPSSFGVDTSTRQRPIRLRHVAHDGRFRFLFFSEATRDRTLRRPMLHGTHRHPHAFAIVAALVDERLRGVFASR